MAVALYTAVLQALILKDSWDFIFECIPKYPRVLNVAHNISQKSRNCPACGRYSGKVDFNANDSPVDCVGGVTVFSIAWMVLCITLNCCFMRDSTPSIRGVILIKRPILPNLSSKKLANHIGAIHYFIRHYYDGRVDFSKQLKRAMNRSHFLITSRLESRMRQNRTHGFRRKESKGFSLVLSDTIWFCYFSY